MHIKFSDIDDKFIKNTVAMGYYTSETELVRDAVRKLRENANLDSMRKLLSTGLEQIEKGETIPYSTDFMDTAMKQAQKNHQSGKPVPDELKPDDFNV